MSSDPHEELKAARKRREDSKLDAVIDNRMAIVFSSWTNADEIGWEQRGQLRGLLRYYSQQGSPFTSCVRDQTERLGPGTVEKVCGTITSIVRGTTKWKGDSNSDGLIASDDVPEISEELGSVLLSMGEEDLQVMFSEADEVLSLEEVFHV